MLIGCYLCIKVFNINEKFAIGIAVFSATVGALVSYLYLYFKKKKDKEDFSEENIIVKEEEKILDRKYLVKQIINCAVPFIIIDLLKSAYGMVDALTVIRGMTYLGYDAAVSELALSTFATWGAKLAMIVISISMGLTISLIPNIANDNINKDHKSVNHKINLSIIALLFITLPMTVGISFLARPIWVLFYSYNAVSIDIFRLFIFTAGSFAIYSVIINIAQTLNHTKQVLITLSLAFTLNLIGNIPFMFLCHKLGIAAYQGASICTLITELGPALYLLLYLKKKHNLKFEELRSKIGKIILSIGAMFIGLYLVSLFYSIDSVSRMGSLIEIFIYMIIGVVIYFFISYKTGLLKDIFGDKLKRFKL